MINSLTRKILGQQPYKLVVSLSLLSDILLDWISPTGRLDTAVRTQMLEHMTLGTKNSNASLLPNLCE